MRNSRTAVSYGALRHRIAVRLKEASETLKKMGYKSQPITAKEFYDYMTGETPTGDTITILDVLDSEFLMLHEVVEIGELKKSGIPINKYTVMLLTSNVYETHYTAIECELNCALEKKNYDWLKVRINHAKSWLEDDDMPARLIPRCKAVIKKFSEALPNGEDKI